MLKLIGTLAKFQAASVLYLLQELERLGKGSGGGMSASMESEEKVVRDLIGILEGSLDDDKRELLNRLEGIQDNVQSRVEKTADNLNLKDYPGKLYENLSPTGMVSNLNKSLHYMLQKMGDRPADESGPAQPAEPPVKAEM